MPKEPKTIFSLETYTPCGFETIETGLKFF